MGLLGGRRLRQIQQEKFSDALADSLRRVHKSSKVIYVDSNTGNNNYNGLRIESPVATIAQAVSLATASQGDQIFVLPNHAETVTSAISMSKADVSITGFELGNKRPVITVNGAVDLFDISGAGCSLSGLDLTIVTTDAATALVNVSGAKVKLSNLKMIPSATAVNVVDCITLASGANDILIDGVQIYNTTVAVNSFLSIEAAVARMKMTNCHFFGDAATAGIIDGATATQIFWQNNYVGTVGTTIPAVILDSNPTGIVDNFFAYGTHGTLASNAQWGNALRLSRIYTLEETDASVQASNIVPALDTN